MVSTASSKAISRSIKTTLLSNQYLNNSLADQFGLASRKSVTNVTPSDRCGRHVNAGSFSKAWLLGLACYIKNRRDFSCLKFGGVNIVFYWMALPQQWPLAQAHWKLKPPKCPVTSSTSPIKYKPFTFFASNVFELISSVFTPPSVTSAFL